MVLSRRAAALAAALTLIALAGCSALFSETKTPLPGKRISVLNLDRDMTADAKVEAMAVRLPHPYDNPDWPDAGGYPSHAMYHLALDNTIRKVWTADVGSSGGRYGRVTAQPVVDGGRVFAMDAHDVVSAFDVKNGRRLWRLNPEPKGDDDETYGGGIAVGGSRAYIATGYGTVDAVDAATGKRIWTRDIGVPIHGAPTLADGRVFVITVENQLNVLAAADGRLLWTHSGIPEPASLLGGASPAVAGDIVVVPYTSGELFALRVENGRVLWSDNLATAQPLGALNSIPDVRSQPVIDRDRVFAVDQSGLMVAIDLRTGDRVWEQDVGSSHAPWAAGDFVYIIDNNDELLCLTRDDGHVRWVRELPRWQNETDKKNALSWTGPVLAGNRIIVASSTGEALSISPYTGVPLGRMNFSDPVFVSPVVAGKSLYVLTADADLIALR